MEKNEASVAPFADVSTALFLPAFFRNLIPSDVFFRTVFRLLQLATGPLRLQHPYD
jgi:hypothetical protein